jgi:tetratricopeptide (TPR) repeat protein
VFLACLLLLAGPWWQVPAHAQGQTDSRARTRSLEQEVDEYIRQGQLSQALARVDRALGAQPDNPRARFLKAVVLAEMNRQDEALAMLNKLTEDFPELPEPHNNLAVIFAQQHQYDKAKSALEMAIRANPGFAVAHENLGDLYLRLASQSFDLALQHDKNNASAQRKMAAVRDLLAPSPAAPAK